MLPVKEGSAKQIAQQFNQQAVGQQVNQQFNQQAVGQQVNQQFSQQLNQQLNQQLSQHKERVGSLGKRPVSLCICCLATGESLHLLPGRVCHTCQVFDQIIAATFDKRKL